MRVKRVAAVFFQIFLFAKFIVAQYAVSGVLADGDDRSPMIGASVKIISADSTKWQGKVTSDNGMFQFENLSSGNYLLRVNYLGYAALEKTIVVVNKDIQLGEITLSKNPTLLKEVNVVENQVRVQQKEDTSEYNASSFKTNKDANVGDLVTKMPGITNENGTIKAHGEEVKKVLIDGKEYFGDDAQLAMKTLPSEMVDKVQVFDQMSDQSFFTGFDDGNSQKAMNILTKKGMNNGVLGKVFAGYGYLTDSRYSAGASVNYLNGNRRLSLIGMSNNVNLQNFSMQDLLGVTGSSAKGGHGGGPPRRGGGGWGNSSIGNFMVGQTGGISTTHSVGLNYADVLGKNNNVKITGSYFFNFSNNVSGTDLTRQYFNAGDSSTYYKESNLTNAKNMNHRINLRVEYRIDSMNNLIFTPKFSYQKNNQTNQIDGENSIAQTELLSKTASRYVSLNSGYNFSANLLWQHKFKKKYRTLSINAGTVINNKTGNTSQNADNTFENAGDSSTLNQQAAITGTSYQINGDIAYTEPAGKSGIIQLGYEPAYTWNNSDKRTDNYDTVAQSYSLLDTSLSNKYDNTYMTHNVSAGYQLKGKKFNLSLGLSGQYALLTGVSIYPTAYQTKRHFYSALPNLRFSYKFNANSNLRIYYRARTSPPTVAQLQSVIDNSNPLLLSTGNPDLKQSYSHFMMWRYGFNNPKNAQSFFAFLSANYTQNYVGNSTFIALSDTLLNDMVLLKRGSQLTQPVNMKGNFSMNTFLGYGLPIAKIKCNLNFNTGFSYSRTPSLINGLQNVSNTYEVKGGFVLGSNINDKIDFTLRYMGSYNIVQNTLQTAANNNYYQHNANLRFNWQFWKGFVFNTELQNTLYAGIAQGYNQNIFLWNAALGYKFLKDESLDVRLSVNDILNQNSGISRTIAETYIEDSKNRVLKRYLLLTVTYTIRSFKKN